MRASKKEQHLNFIFVKELGFSTLKSATRHTDTTSDSNPCALVSSNFESFWKTFSVINRHTLVDFQAFLERLKALSLLGKIKSIKPSWKDKKTKSLGLY